MSLHDFTLRTNLIRSEVIRTYSNTQHILATLSIMEHSAEQHVMTTDDLNVSS